MDQQQDRLNFLLQRYTDKTLTAPQQEELYALLLQDWNRFSNSEQAAPVDWEKMVREIVGASNNKVHRIHFLRTTWFKYAAAILVILLSASYLWNTQKEKPSVATTINPVPVQNDVAPGGNKATLTLADGSTIILDSASNGKIAQQENATITKKGDQIVYTREVSGVPTTVSYNTMSTPRGGQYQLALPDGSQVWLNAESSITFPTAFTGNERKVSISGEAYFEVAKDKTKPFKVDIDNGTIEVLGTHFNVNTYQDEPMANITLLEGSVRIKTVHTSLTLKPGQQGQLSDQQLSLAEHPDLEKVMAWKNGFFNFNNMTLEESLRQLARWYDVSVEFEGVKPDIILAGAIGRSLNLSEVLEGLNAMGLKTRLEPGKKLVILN